MTLHTMAVGALSLVKGATPRQYTRADLSGAARCLRIAGCWSFRKGFEIDRHGTHVNVGQILQAVVYNFRHWPIHRALPGRAGFEQIDDVLDTPVPKSSFLVEGEGRCVPVLHRNQSAGEGLFIGAPT